MTDADKIRYLAGLAGWRYDTTGAHFQLPDYPNSLDAIARDLLPLLREKGWEHEMYWDSDGYTYYVRNGRKGIIGRGKHWDEPARAAFEAIFEALHGGEE